MTTAADSALFEAVCRVETAALAHDGLAHATRLTAAAVRMVTVGGVLSVRQMMRHWSTDVAPRMLWIVLTSSAIGGVFLVAT